MRARSFNTLIVSIAPHLIIDDSHKVIRLVPKNRPTGNLLFRRSFLSLLFYCACHIQIGTLNSRDLYPKYIQLDILMSLSIPILTPLNTSVNEFYEVTTW